MSLERFLPAFGRNPRGRAPETGTTRSAPAMDRELDRMRRAVSFPATRPASATGRAARVEYQRGRVFRVLQQLGTGRTEPRSSGHARPQVEHVAGACSYGVVVRQLTRIDGAAQPLLDEGHGLRIGPS